MAIQDGDKTPQMQVTSNDYPHVLTELDSVSLALQGSADTQSEVRADGGDDANTGALYVSSVGKTWQKVADDKVDADWTLFTGVNVFNQDLNTTDSPTFNGATFSGDISAKSVSTGFGDPNVDYFYGESVWVNSIHGGSGNVVEVVAGTFQVVNIDASEDINVASGHGYRINNINVLTGQMPYDATPTATSIRDALIAVGLMAAS